MIMRAAYGYDVKAASDDEAYVEDCPGRTVQSEKDSADINFILKNFGVTGMAPQVPAPPTYGDFDSVSDYQSAMNVILAANRSFEMMPANVRTRFNNNPAEFVAFCDDPANLEEARKLGVAVPEPVKEVPPVVPPVA